MRHLQADTVDIKPINQSAADIAHLAYYMFKAPWGGKFRRKNPDKYFLDQLDPVEIRPALALRMAEVLSQLQLTELVRSVGAEATAVVNDWREDMAAWRAQRRTAGLPMGRQVDAATMWKRLRKLNPSKATRRPVQIVRSGAVPTETAWQAAAKQALSRIAEKRTKRPPSAHITSRRRKLDPFIAQLRKPSTLEEL